MPNTTCSNKINFCSACQLGKSHKLPFTSYPSKAYKPFELIHIDLWGPAPLLSKNGFRYYIISVDGFSRYVWTYPLKNKNEALSTFIQFETSVETQFETKIKCIHNGIKYLLTYSLYIYPKWSC